MKPNPTPQTQKDNHFPCECACHDPSYKYETIPCESCTSPRLEQFLTKELTTIATKSAEEERKRTEKILRETMSLFDYDHEKAAIRTCIEAIAHKE